MNPRKPYRPGRTVPRIKRREDEPGRGSWWSLLVLGLLAVGIVLLFRWRSATSALDATPSIDLSVTPPEGALTQDAPPPTSTLFPFPSPTPTPIRTPSVSATLLYTTQSGDTLPALAARFGVNPDDLRAPQALRGSTTLESGQLIVIPRVFRQVGPGEKLIPDSELVLGGGAAGFDPAQFAAEQGGYLKTYKWFVDGLNRSGGDVIRVVAQHHSINPRLLAALLEYQSGWVTQSRPTGEALTYPLGYVHLYRKDLYSQLSWAASQLAIGYYGWRAGTLTELTFTDGAAVRLDPTLNAGTVALHYFLSRTRTQAAWESAVGPDGFIAVYRQFFGNPFARAVDPLLPADLVQPALALPFLPGHTWYYSGGPHGAWENGGALAALDFAPASLVGGCAESQEWVTAMGAGLVVRSEFGSVLLDLDGDGREATGWVILYLHIAEKDRVKAGTFVETGDRIGHPSCEGGVATGTHVHVARKYNGEWIPADSLIPFNLSGWVAHQGKGEYFGTLTREGVAIEACTCTAAWTAITADQ